MLELVRLNVETVMEAGDYARFQIGPLERGFGITLGNALRRVLLSALPGAAVTAVKIAGVYHEFSALPGVVEDVTDIILNIKQLRLRSYAEGEARLFLQVRGPKEVTAADIVCPSNVEIVNPELHIATLDSEEALLDIEFVVERGRGYRGAEEREESLDIGVIAVDAIFTPVRHVNFVVEQVGAGSPYENLILEVTTDGSMAPAEALTYAAQLLAEQFGTIAEMGKEQLPGEAQEVVGPEAVTFPIPPELYEIPIEDLGLTTRVQNALVRGGIKTVGELLEKDRDELMTIRNFGERALEEVKQKLLEKGYLPDVDRVGPLMSGQ